MGKLYRQQFISCTCDYCDEAHVLQHCIPGLIKIVKSEMTNDVQLASLQALTNLAVTSKYHLPYTQVGVLCVRGAVAN